MTGKARVGMLTIALLALSLVGVGAQGTTAGQKPPDAKPTQAAATDTQAKPADAKADAAQEEMPADFTAFNNAGKEKDPQKRVEAYEKFIADHPKSPLVSMARSQIQSTLLATLKTVQAKYLDAMQQQIETAKKGTSPGALSIDLQPPCVGAVVRRCDARSSRGVCQDRPVVDGRAEVHPGAQAGRRARRGRVRQAGGGTAGWLLRRPQLQQRHAVAATPPPAPRRRRQAPLPSRLQRPPGASRSR